MQVIVIITVFLSLLHSTKTSIYLFNTQDGSNIEHYDCFYIDSSPYCRRPRNPINLIRTNQHFCNEMNNGKIHRFSDLRSKNVSISTVLHQWESSLEQVEAFGRYLRDRNESDGDLCQCQREYGFGKFCEYQLPIKGTLEDILNWQVMMRNVDQWEIQRLGHITCYDGISCNSGVLCLDWREICDGTQNCMFGLDEENCDILEMNICDDDEYRCANGMCIPQQYFLDGERDCLDGADEMRLDSSVNCPRERVNEQCDDHICLPNEWSCGDGQCIFRRLAFQTDAHMRACSNRRDQYFMCEMHYTTPMWTMPNGRCNGVKGDVEDSPSNRTKEEECEYLLKCFLSKGKEKTCPCKEDAVECLERLQETCPNQTIPYPKGAFLAPFLFFFFNTTRHPEDFSPSSILINGTVKCGGSFVNVTRWIDSIRSTAINGIIYDELCNRTNSLEWIDPSDQCFRANESTDVCSEWNPCLSITRIKDGWNDCWSRQDEKDQTGEEIKKSCSGVQRHRFNCSIDQPTCLRVTTLGDSWNHCANRDDEVWHGTYQKLFQMKCDAEAKDDCSRLRQYIEQSWAPIRKNDTREVVRMAFRFYCDTIRDLKSEEDENRVKCQQWWKCARGQHRCETGQCIYSNWLNDGEWDCPDVSDETKRFKIMMRRMQEQVRINQSSDEVTLALDTCHSSSSFVCLSPHSRRRQLICLNQSQLGDKKIDCLGAIDEQNTLQHCSQSSSILGHNFFCPSTNHCVSWLNHCRGNNRCPNQTDDHHWCSRSTTDSSCMGTRDFICFNGTCLQDSRCNEEFQCPFGEDEYMCDYSSVKIGFLVPYRYEKELNARPRIQSIQLPVFPNHLNITRPNVKEISLLPSATPTRSSPSSSLLTRYRCNRGLGILSYNDSIVCFCPPQYYGDFCEYHSDRLLVLLHLNLTQSIYTPDTDPTIVIKLLVLFLFEDQLLMKHEFHLRPALEISTFNKKMIYFPYSRSRRFRQHRQNRYFNRTNILHFHPYSIRIEAFEMDVKEKLSLIAVWQYPIIFDYLPVFRFAKVLHLTKTNQWDRNPCSNHRCPSNAECYPLMNNLSQSICLCKSGFSGENCSIRDEQCAAGHCVSPSLCKPNYRSSLHDNTTPFCLCPFNRYGDRCDIIHDYCQLDPCLNGGTCSPTSQPNQIVCLCTKEYRGSRCQTSKPRVRLSLIDTKQYAGAVVQYLHIDYASLNLLLLDHQQAHKLLPRSINYHSDSEWVPAIIVTKTYDSHEGSSSNLYLLSVVLYRSWINGTTEMSDVNRCESVHNIAKGNSSHLHPSVSSPIEYHRLCIENHRLICFRDEAYLCICGLSHSYVECFLYDDQLDRCSKCFSGGRCLRGDPKQSNDFLCLCPSCYSGRQCQFNSKSFAFTLDQLLYTDLTSSAKETTSALLIIFSLFGFLLAIPNNLFSFITFRRRSCLQNGIGHYLLCLSLVNQITLTLLLARLLHIILSLTIHPSHPLLSDLICKLLTYSLSCSMRVSLWLSTFVALERVYTTIFLTAHWFKQPHIARRLMISTFAVILLSAVYELIFTKSFSGVDEKNGAICVTEFPLQHQSLWTILHQIVSIGHFLLPILINIGCTFTIITVVIRTKMNLHQRKTRESFFSYQGYQLYPICTSFALFHAISNSIDILVEPSQIFSLFSRYSLFRY